MVDVYVEVCREGVRLPKYAKKGDAGMDILAAKDVSIKPGETKAIPTGLKFAIPEGYEIQVRPRSGLSLNSPLRISNTPGTIDSGYRDEVGIIVTNISPLTADRQTKIYYLTEKGNKKGQYNIKRGDKIAQIVLSKVPQINFKRVKKVADIGENRGGGFGSTGVNDEN